MTVGGRGKWISQHFHYVNFLKSSACRHWWVYHSISLSHKCFLHQHTWILHMCMQHRIQWRRNDVHWYVLTYVHVLMLQEHTARLIEQPSQYIVCMLCIICCTVWHLHNRQTLLHVTAEMFDHCKDLSVARCIHTSESGKCTSRGISPGYRFWSMNCLIWRHFHSMSMLHMSDLCVVLKFLWLCNCHTILRLVSLVF